MKKIAFILFLGSVLISWRASEKRWEREYHKEYSMLFQQADIKNIKEYSTLIDNGINSAKYFFNSSFKNKFEVIVHPNRNSLDSAWRIYFKSADFKSDCWMVASGDANKLDIISPILWDSLSCEHKYNDKKKTQQLITHELVHVFHGQYNLSPDFSNTENIDWFVEGLATYASGQLDSIRISEIKKAISNEKIPESLDNFWTGKLKYGLSGSVVMYIDKKYGRKKLEQLLPLNKKVEVLSTLNITESALLTNWKNYITAL